MENKALAGLMEAPPYKRYKSFLTTAVDREIVWLVNSKEYNLEREINNYILIPVWAGMDFCVKMCGRDEEPFAMEVHEFLDWLNALTGNIFFAVAPNAEDFICVAKDKLIEEFEAYLSEVE